MWQGLILIATHSDKVLKLCDLTIKGVTFIKDAMYKQKEDVINEENECPVCRNQFKDDDGNVDNVKVKLPKCGHEYHLSCLNRLREFQEICGICEKNIKATQPDV